jgi:HAD superfamily hydrolase (TIGR01509 family)
MGMSSHEWAAYMHDSLGVRLEADEIDRLVVARMESFYRARLPLLPGAVDAVRALASRWPLGLASSSNREIIDLALSLAGVADAFAVTVSSEEVARGKPAPDVYLEACRRLDVPAAESVAVEDSSNGLRSASAAEMSVIAVPNPHYPPDADALRLAAGVIESLDELTPELVEKAYERGGVSGDH